MELACLEFAEVEEEESLCVVVVLELLLESARRFLAIMSWSYFKHSQPSLGVGQVHSNMKNPRNIWINKYEEVQEK